MNNPSHQNKYRPSNLPSPISYQQHPRRFQNQPHGNFIQGSPFNQMENFPLSQDQPVQKVDRQKNIMFQSSMEFSKNRNPNQQPRASNIQQPNSAFNPWSPTLNFNTQCHQGQPFQQGVQYNQTERYPPLRNQNLNQNSIQFEKRSIIFSNNVHNLPPQTLNHQSFQNTRPNNTEHPQARKKVNEIDAIRKQLEDINGRMKRLGLSQPNDQAKNEELQTKLTSNKNLMENWHPRNQNQEVAHSMIVNEGINGQQQVRNQNNRTLLSLEETYQINKRKQTIEDHIKTQKLREPLSHDNFKTPNETIPSTIKSFNEPVQSNSQNIEQKEQPQKKSLTFAPKERRNTKAKTQLILGDQQMRTPLEHSKPENMKLSYIQPQSNDNPLGSRNSINSFPSFLLRDSNNKKVTLQSNNNRYQTDRPKGSFDQQQTNFNQFPTLSTKTATKTVIEQKVTRNQSEIQNYTSLQQQRKPVSPLSQPTVQSQASSVEEPEKSLFKKKGFQPEYQLSGASMVSEDCEIKKTSSQRELNMFGEPEKIKKSDFQIGKKMGKGQFGEVQLVRHKSTGFICGMKTMSKKQIKEQRYQGQISRQLSIQFYLTHRNITPLYGYFEDQGNIYLLIQFCPDGHLLDILKKVRRMQEEDCSPIIKQICEGIDYIHKEKIIHRDIKPQNVLFVNGVAKIVDFGWAVYRGMGLRKTASGSPLYYSPEIVLGTEYDQKIDIWDIGMMTYQCLLGKVPFKVYTEMDLCRIVSDEVTFPSYVDVTDQAKDFILKILQKKPQDRLTIREMLRHPFITKYSEKKISIEIMKDIQTTLN